MAIRWSIWEYRLCYWPQEGDPGQTRIDQLCDDRAGMATALRWLSVMPQKRDATLEGSRSTRFALFKITVGAQQIYFRYNGQTHDQRFKDFDKRVAGLLALRWT